MAESAESVDKDVLKASRADEESLLESQLTFTPRVSEQRYTFVKEIIRDLKSKRVIDMGCGECHLIVKLKRELCIEQLAGIDVNDNFLGASKHLIQPLLYEYIHGREAPLEATLYHGSIAERDSRLVGWDLLACVEVIEHLEDHDLQRVPDTIFGFLRPVVAVFTTPNADFNVLFPDMENRFRHWDHKFEWTRQQFQEWGDNVCSKYGYKVRYTGVGNGPDGTEHLGLCSQIAVFERLERQHEDEHHNQQQQEHLVPYKVVQHSKYPYKPDTMTTENKILLEAEYYACKLSIDASKQQSSDEEVIEDEDDDGQFDDAEEVDDASDNSFGRHIKSCRDDLRTSSKDDARTTFCEDEDGNTFVAIPLSRLMEFNSLQKICPSIDILRSTLKSSEKLTLSTDESSVLCPIPEEEKYSLLSEAADLQDFQEEEINRDKDVGRQEIDTQEDTPEECWDSS